MAASPQYGQVLRSIAALRTIGLISDVNSYEEIVGDGLHIIDFKERNSEMIPGELSELYRAVRNAWDGVEELDEFINRDLRRSYTVKFVDSATACFQCSFKDGGLIKQRVAYQQSPFFRSYGSEELYEYLDQATDVGLDEYWKLFAYKEPCIRELVSFRYDFDPSAFQAKLHPLAHLHLGDSESCRVCSESPVDIRSFFSFLVAQFYARKRDEFEDVLNDWNGYTRYPNSIHADEQPLPFFSWGRT